MIVAGDAAAAAVTCSNLKREAAMKFMPGDTGGEAKIIALTPVANGVAVYASVAVPSLSIDNVRESSDAGMLNAGASVRFDEPVLERFWFTLMYACRPVNE